MPELSRSDMALKKHLWADTVSNDLVNSRSSSSATLQSSRCSTQKPDPFLIFLFYQNKIHKVLLALTRTLVKDPILSHYLHSCSSGPRHLQGTKNDSLETSCLTLVPGEFTSMQHQNYPFKLSDMSYTLIKSVQSFSLRIKLTPSWSLPDCPSPLPGPWPHLPHSSFSFPFQPQAGEFIGMPNASEPVRSWV